MKHYSLNILFFLLKLKKMPGGGYFGVIEKLLFE